MDMDNDLVNVNEDSNLSFSSTYSDIVSSETEAELYSMIHHQENPSHSESPKNGFVNGESNIDNFINNKFQNTKNLQSDHYRLYSPKNNQHNDHNISSQVTPERYRNKKCPSSILYPRISESKINTSAKMSTPTKRKSTFDISKQDMIPANSSDSEDSIIWTELDSFVAADLKTNLLKDCNTLLTKVKSQNPDFIIASEKNEIHEKIETSFQSFNMKSNSKDLWYIDDSDLCRKSKKSKRYHIDIHLQCSNCGFKGHSAKSCDMPRIIKCFFCGGKHLGSQCENRICSKCYEMGHDYRQCWKTFTGFCYHCNMKGHLKRDCPDIWRRYHLTTKSANIISGRPAFQNKSIYCFNCGWSGHFGSECNEPRFQSTIWPCVISYNNPDDLLSKRNDFQRMPQHVVANHTKHCTSLEQLESRKRVKSKSKYLGRAHKKFIEKKQAIKEKNLMKERDFPRMSKPLRNESSSENILPESVQLEIKRLAKNRKKNRNRRQKKKQQQLCLQSPEIITLSP